MDDYLVSCPEKGVEDLVREPTDFSGHRGRCDQERKAEKDQAYMNETSANGPYEIKAH